MEIGFCERPIDTGLISTEGAAALQQQGNALERRAFREDVTFPVRTQISGHLKRLLQYGAA